MIVADAINTLFVNNSAYLQVSAAGAVPECVRLLKHADRNVSKQAGRCLKNLACRSGAISIEQIANVEGVLELVRRYASPCCALVGCSKLQSYFLIDVG